MGEEKRGENVEKAILRNNVLRDVNYLLSKGFITNEEVYFFIKKFLKKYLELDYEFTQEELFEELRNIYLPYDVKDDFLEFIDKIFIYEYSDLKYSDKELRVFLEEFKTYIDYLLSPPKSKNKIGGVIFLRKWRNKALDILHKINIIPKHIAEKNKSPVHDLELMDNIKSSHITLNKLIEEVYYSLDNGDVDSAINTYKKVIGEYNHLEPVEKDDYYETIVSTYNSIQKVKASS